MNIKFREVQKHFRSGDKTDFNSPDRKQLPNFIYLGQQPKELAEEVYKLLDKLGSDHNDINQPSYSVSKKFPSILKSFPKDYIQIMLQNYQGEGLLETDYCLPKHTRITDILELYVKNFFRARIAVLHPGRIIDYHIDTNTNQMCRVQFPIQAEQLWYIRRNGETEEKILKPGEIWFVNTGFAHKVINEEGVDRITVLLGCKYDRIKDNIGEFRTDT